MFPLQVPGGSELLVIGLIFLLPVAIIGGIVYLGRRSNTTSPDEQRVTELEQRVKVLEERVESGDDHSNTDQHEGW